jgi:hypothetical protein
MGAEGGTASRQGEDATAARRSLQIDSFVAANLPPPAAARPLEEDINFFKPKGGARRAESNGGTNAAQSKVCIPAAILLMSFNLKVETNWHCSPVVLDILYSLFNTDANTWREKEHVQVLSTRLYLFCKAQPRSGIRYVSLRMDWKLLRVF